MAAVLTLAAGCGGGGGSATTPAATVTPPLAATQAAVFSDAPVIGLSYSASPSGVSGVTDALGLFKYAPGDTVTFSVAGVTLGSATNLLTTSTAGSPAVITPISLVAGASSASNATVTAIGQFLAGLNSVAVAVGQGNGGSFTIPTAAGLTGPNATKVSTLLASLQSSGATAATLAAAVASGGAAQSAISAAGGALPSPANAQANITQGLNGGGVVGTVWSGSCAICSNGAGGTLTLYFNADGAVFGFGAIGAAGNTYQRMIGTWQPNASASSGATFTLVTGTQRVNTNGGGTSTVLDGNYLSGSVSGTSGSAQVYDATRTAQGSPITLTAAPPPAAGTSTAYLGAYLLTLGAQTAAGQATGGVAGSSAIFLAEPNGTANVTGNNASGASVDLATGTATVTVTTNGIPTTCGGNRPALTQTVSFSLANGTLSNTVAGALAQSGTVTRMTHGLEVLESFQDNGNTQAEVAAEQVIPLALNVTIDWPASSPSATSALVLGVALAGLNTNGTSCNPGPGAQKLEAFGLRPELNPLGAGAAAATVGDTFSVGYVKGQAQTYAVSVLGPAAQYCSVTANGTGSITDASSGNAALYPTVAVHCTQ